MNLFNRKHPEALRRHGQRAPKSKPWLAWRLCLICHFLLPAQSEPTWWLWPTLTDLCVDLAMIYDAAGLPTVVHSLGKTIVDDVVAFVAAATREGPAAMAVAMRLSSASWSAAWSSS